MSQHSEETRRVLLCVALSYVSAQWKAFTFFALCFGLTGALDKPGSTRFVFAHRASPIVHLIHCANSAETFGSRRFEFESHVRSSAILTHPPTLPPSSARLL